MLNDDERPIKLLGISTPSTFTVINTSKLPPNTPKEICTSSFSTASNTT